MVTLRKRPRTQETPVNPKQTNTNSKSSTEVSGYELCREKRIKENMERMQKLGIFDLSNKLKSGVLLPNKRSPRKVFDEKSSNHSSPLRSSLPSRRSSRLQNATPVSYAEVHEKRTKKEEDLLGPLVGEGSQAEIYTDEHEKLLGTCHSTWDLFVDGYTKDGVRIYDPINGKSCHQCRQKTLGHRTHCIECNLVRGQFCGDCLYMRYGEHVLEANQNPNWICPVCRGICNCSLCRKAKGWPATGALYRRIAKLGFKSVAHYLIQTRRAETKSDEIGTDDQVSMKRSLSFTATEEVFEHSDSITSEDWQQESPKPGFIDNRGNEAQDEHATGEKEGSTSEHGATVTISEAKPDSIAGRLRQRRSRS